MKWKVNWIRKLIEWFASFVFYLFFISYELDNGQIVSETGELKTIGEQQVVVKSGQYSFVAADGITYWVNWTADENGFHPVIGENQWSS